VAAEGSGYRKYRTLTVKFPELVDRVGAALKVQRPGADAHNLLAPRPRRQWPEDFNPARIREAAGLLLLFPIDDVAHIVLTVRAETLRHAGQVSLPGGVVEPGETFEQAALREAHEEIGLPLDRVQVVGALTPLDIPVSGFRLHPIVAVTDARPAFTPSDGEVARILEVAVHDLCRPERLVMLERGRGGQAVSAPAFRVGADEIWGATAMVLAELLVLLGWKPHAREPTEAAEDPTEAAEDTD